jgi:hypothetical protein
MRTAHIEEGTGAEAVRQRGFDRHLKPAIAQRRNTRRYEWRVPAAKMTAKRLPIRRTTLRLNTQTRRGTAIRGLGRSRHDFRYGCLATRCSADTHGHGKRRGCEHCDAERDRRNLMNKPAGHALQFGWRGWTSTPTPSASTQRAAGGFTTALTATPDNSSAHCL